MNKPVLRYERVKRYILDGIGRGQWQRGARIPSENELADRFSMSRMTVNRAINELAGEGVLDRIQGKGTFVARPRPLQSVLKIQAIDDEIRMRGNEYSCRLLGLGQEEVAAAIGGQMQLPTGSRVFCSTIVHLENDLPVQLEQRWVNPVVAADYLKQDFVRMTPHRYLTQLAPFTSGEHTVEAWMPDSRTRRWLKMKAGEPCLLIHRRTWVRQTVASYVRLTHPGTRYQLNTQLQT